MLSTVERFWITFILRFAFGFLFLFAAIGIFSYGAEEFAADLARPIADSWIGNVEASVVSTFQTDVEFDDASRDAFATGFLIAVPYIFCALSVCILTGIFLRPALRLGAIMMILLGLGKYLTNDVATTADDFLFALIICIGLYFLGQQKKARERVVEEPPPVTM